MRNRPSIGRPRAAVGFKNVCNALVAGKGKYSGAAKILSEEKGKTFTARSVFNRIKRQAVAIGYPMQDLVKELMETVNGNSY